MENPIKMDDLGFYTIFGNTHISAPKYTPKFIPWIESTSPQMKVRDLTNGSRWEFPQMVV